MVASPNDPPEECCSGEFFVPDIPWTMELSGIEQDGELHTYITRNMPSNPVDLNGIYFLDCDSPPPVPPEQLAQENRRNHVADEDDE